MIAPMTSRQSARLGAILGLILGIALSAILDSSQMASGNISRTYLLSDCEGSLGDIVIHYLPEAAGVVLPIYRRFLSELPRDVIVHVVCPTHEVFDEFAALMVGIEARLSPVIVGHAVTCWSRDRWLALAPEQEEAGTTLLLPSGELGSGVWPARAGDQRVGFDVAHLMSDRVQAYRSELFFDGGDFVADSRTVFVTPSVLDRNLGQRVRDRDDLIRQLSRVLGRSVVLLKDAPPYHAGMFMMTVGSNTVLVGDPAAARELIGNLADKDVDRHFGAAGADFRDHTIAQFDAVAQQCREAGYRVVRIPVVPGRDGRTYLTYLNVIIDTREQEKTVYMPVFDEPLLDDVACRVWTELGFDVRSIDCRSSYRHFGSLRCLVNVLRRTSSQLREQGRRVNSVEKTPSKASK